MSKEIREEKTKITHQILNIKAIEDEFKYKTYKGLFKKLRKKDKTTYYSKLLHRYKTHSKRT